MIPQLSSILLVSPEHESLRLDAFLALLLPRFSRSNWQDQIIRGLVTVDSITVYKPSFKLHSGQTVIAMNPIPIQINIQPAPEIPISIVYIDPFLVVINKQPGLTVHPGAGTQNNTLVHALLAAVGDLAPAGGELRPGIVHRLDKDTSGLMVVARTDEAYHSLRKQFSLHTVNRGYLFLAWGTLPEKGTIEAPISRSPHNRLKMTTTNTGKPALTSYRLIDATGALSMGQALLSTGRTHQVRVHLASIGHPLVGDTRYGGKSAGGLTRQALHSAYLGFTHPASGELLVFQSHPAPDMTDCWVKLGGNLITEELTWQGW